MYYIYHIYYISYMHYNASKSMDTLTWKWYPTNLRIMRRKYSLVMFGFCFFEDWRINYFLRGMMCRKKLFQLCLVTVFWRTGGLIILLSDIMCRKYYLVIFGSSLFHNELFFERCNVQKIFFVMFGYSLLWSGILSTS